MTPPSMESMFLILSGVILVAGILYWFWSHIQLTQKKVQLLENAVFELRGMLTSRGAGPPSSPSPSPSPSAVQANIPVTASAPGTASVYNDLADDGWDDGEGEGEGSSADDKELAVGSTSLEELGLDGGSDVGEGPMMVVKEDVVSEELQPGGRILVPTEAEQNGTEERGTEEFRDLFLNGGDSGTAAASVARTPESLESMPVKELRRLGEQRGIPGAAEMRKKELLAALRQQVSGGVQTSGGAVSVERTLDLTETGAVVEEAPALE